MLIYSTEIIASEDAIAVKDGRMFRMFYTTSLVAGASLNILSIHGATKTHIFHNRVLSNNGSYFTVSAYAEPTTSSNGTEIPVYNLKATSSNLPESKYYHTPTVSNDGTLVDREFLAGGTGQGGKQAFGSGSTSAVFSILNLSGKILTRITNSGTETGNIAISFYFEEIPPDF